MSRGKPVVARGWVPQGDGTYKNLEDLTPEERKAFGDKLAERIGRTVNRYYSAHPEEIPRFLAATS